MRPKSRATLPDFFGSAKISKNLNWWPPHSAKREFLETGWRALGELLAPYSSPSPRFMFCKEIYREHWKLPQRG
jgi:hypothetical protein